MKLKIYIVKGHFEPFWYRHHATVDMKQHLKTLVIFNIGLQVSYGVQ